MASRAELDAARAALLASQRRVRRKAAYQSRAHGVDYGMPGQAKMVPLVEREKVRRYTLRQVQVAQERADAFLSRRTQHYGDRIGRIIATDIVRENQRLQRKSKRQKLEMFDKVAHIKTMGVKPGMLQPITINDQARMSVLPRNVGITRTANDNPYNVYEKRPSSYESVKAMKLANEKLAARTAPGWEKRDLESKRQQMIDMFSSYKSSEGDAVVDAVKKMDERTFRVFSADRRAWDAGALRYDMFKERKGPEGPYRKADIMAPEAVQTLETNLYSDAHMLMKWARSQVRYYGKKGKGTGR